MRVMEVLNEHGKTLKGSKILIAGLAYKPNVDDDRESPSYHLMEKLEAHGAVVAYNDPYVPMIRDKREYPEYTGRKSVPLSGEYDLILIATGHDEYKNVDFTSFGTLIVDTRNVVQKKNAKVYQA